MRLVVYVGDTVRGKTLGVAHYASNLVSALASRHDIELTLLGAIEALHAFSALPGVELVVESDLPALRRLESRTELVIQVHQFQPRLLEVPTTLVVHDLHVYDVGWKYARGRQNAVWKLHKNVIRADAVVSHFPNTIDRLAELEPLSIGKTHLTVCPTLIEDFSLDDEIAEGVRHRLDIGEARPMILYPAQKQLHKNHWNLLSVVKELQRVGREPQLICTGSDAYPPSWADALEERVRYLGLREVQFTGYVSGEELRSLYRLATAVVSPSLAEGGAYIAQEALVHDTAVTCSAIPAVEAHLKRMELDVPVFDPYDIDDMTLKISETIDDPGSITSGYGTARGIVASWTWDRLASEVLSSSGFGT